MRRGTTVRQKGLGLGSMGAVKQKRIVFVEGSTCEWTRPANGESTSGSDSGRFPTVPPPPPLPPAAPAPSRSSSSSSSSSYAGDEKIRKWRRDSLPHFAVKVAVNDNETTTSGQKCFVDWAENSSLKRTESNETRWNMTQMGKSARASQKEFQFGSNRFNWETIGLFKWNP